MDKAESGKAKSLRFFEIGLNNRLDVPVRDTMQVEYVCDWDPNRLVRIHALSTSLEWLETV